MSEIKNKQHTEDMQSGEWEGECERCGALIFRARGTNDQECPDCGAFYNCFGQRLRDDLRKHPNPSEYDENIGDMEGYEIAMSAADLIGEHQGTGYEDVHSVFDHPDGDNHVGL